MTVYHNPPQKGVEYIFYLGLVSQSTGQFQSNPTIAAGDFKVSTDGGAYTNLNTLPAVDPAAGKSVKVTLSTTEMNGANVVIVGSDAAGAEWDDVMVNIQPSISFNATGQVGIDLDNTVGTLAKGTDITGFNDLSAAQVNAEADTALADVGVTTTVTGRIDAAISTRSTLTAANVWDALLTGITTIGSIGKLIKDYLDAAISSRLASASYTAPDNATIATIQADTNDIQSRLPAALSGDGFMKADLKSIDDELTSGNNATLNLKQLTIVNNTPASYGLYVESTGDAMVIYSTGGNGAVIGGAVMGVDIQGEGGDAARFLATGGKSINAPQDIAVSDGNLTLAAIANAVWTNATRTLTAIADSAGVTTLLSRIGGALNISGGKVESNVKQINDTNVTGNGSSGNPWGPA